MAEENAKVTTNGTTEVVTEETLETSTDAEVANETPTVEELLAKLAQAESEKKILKASNDKLSKESAESKRALRAKMTEAEREDEAKKEEDRLKDEKLNEALSELNHIKAVAAYKAISDEKIVEELINAISDADHAAIANIIENEKSKAVKIAQAEWMKSRPPVNNGSGVAMTKEQILAIQDSAERQRAIAANIELFQ